jgi:uncharacterized protein (DUF1015 family)
METLVLKTSIKIDGQDVKEIKYDFENLSQRDMAEAEKRMTGNGQMSMTLEEMNYSWHSYLFAAAAAKANEGTDISDYMRITGTDALRARKLARNFILAVEDGEQEN